MTPLPLPGTMSPEFRENTGTQHRNACRRGNKRVCTHRILIRDFVLFRAPLEAHDSRLSVWSRQRGAACAPWLYRSAACHCMGPCAKAARPRTQTLSASSGAAALPPDCRRGTRWHTLSAKMRLRHAAPSLDGSAAARDSWDLGPARRACSSSLQRHTHEATTATALATPLPPAFRERASRTTSAACAILVRLPGATRNRRDGPLRGFRTAVARFLGVFDTDPKKQLSVAVREGAVMSVVKPPNAVKRANTIRKVRNTAYAPRLRATAVPASPCRRLAQSGRL